MVPCQDSAPGMEQPFDLAGAFPLRAFPSPAPHLTVRIGMVLLTVGDGNKSWKVESLTGGNQEPQPEQPPYPGEGKAELGFQMETTSILRMRDEMGTTGPS